MLSLLSFRLISLSPQSIQELSKSIYIPRGINTEALDRALSWDFDPVNFKVVIHSSMNHHLFSHLVAFS